MRNPILILPIVSLALLGATALQAPTWGPIEPAFQLVMTYRADAFVLDHGLTREDCTHALPYGDSLKHVHFSCEREG